MNGLFLRKIKRYSGIAFVFVIFAVCLSFSSQAAMSESEIKDRLSSYSEGFTAYEDGTLYIDYSEWNVTQEQMYYVVSDIAEALMGEPVEDYCQVSVRFYYKPGVHGNDLNSFGEYLFKYQKALGNFWTEWSRYNNMEMIVTSHSGGKKYSAGVTLSLNGCAGTYGKKYTDKLLSIVKQAEKTCSNKMETVQYFLNWLDENVDYRYYTGFTNDPYYALIYGKTVCGGYANAFKDLCNAAGIPATVPVSESLNHAWSQVYVDGIWYTADLCNVVKSKSETYSGYLFTDPDTEYDCKSFVDSHKSEYVKSFRGRYCTNINSCSFSYDSSKKYTGSAIKPAVTVRYNGKTLTEGTHYKVSYSGNTLPGTASIIIDGISKNGYKGSKILTFKISLPRPATLTASTEKTTATLKWSKVTGADGYIIRLYDTDSKKYIDLSRVKGTSCRVTELVPGRKYTFAVKAYVTASGTEYRSSQTKTYVVTNPSQVKGLTIYSVKADSLKLKWSASDVAERYEIYMSADGKKWEKKASTSKTSYTVKALKANKKYYFKVRAVNSSGKGKFSSSKSTTTLLAAPELKLTAGNDSLKARWNKISGAKGYTVYYSTDKEMMGCKKITVSGKSSVSSVISSLKDGKKYYVRVRAYKTVNGEKVYGQYSSIIGIKVK